MMTEPRSQTGEGRAAALSERLSVRIPLAVELTGISRTKLYELIKTGQVQIVKVGAATVIPVESLRQFIDKNRR
jgi:predicted DNA-binding transcriptional regulator AlpA